MKWRRFCIFIVLSIMVQSFSIFGIEDEYYRKAALLKVFSQYIRWPGGSGMEDRTKHFVIGVIGKNPFGSILEKAYSRQEYKIKNKKVKILAISRINKQTIESCHILFISKSAAKELEQILAVTRGKPILTIGETKGFGEKGVLFNLYVSKNEIRFEINASALGESGLIIDSQLLSAARIIKLPEKNNESSSPSIDKK